MATTRPVHLIGTIGITDRPERYLLEIVVDDRGESTFTVSTDDAADGGHLVLSDAEEAAWIIGQVAQGIYRLTAHLSQPQAA